MRDEAGQHVEHGGLAGAGAAGDQHVQAAADDGLEHQRDGRGQGAHLHQALAVQQVHGEAADRHARPVYGQRRNDGVDPRTVLQPRVHQRRGLVDAPPEAGDDAVDDVQQVLVVAEAHIGALQLAVALDVDRGVAVDQDVRHAAVGQQRLQRPEAEHLVGDLLDDQLAATGADRRRMLVEQALADLADLPPRLGRFEAVEQRQVHDLEQLLVDLLAPLGLHRVELGAGFVEHVRGAGFPGHGR
ncbi:hypothetical protein D3C76_1172880 [compost metagenome]